MTAPQEVEVKFLVHDAAGLGERLRQNGFTQKTPPTHEINTLYDLPDQRLRTRGEILRLRKYGDTWKLTHKSRGSAGKHKTRIEHETVVADGAQMHGILTALGYEPSFTYEKYRAEWTDRQGEVVIDRTPIGIVAEIEGSPDWIDRTAALLGIAESDYITKSYGDLFLDWRKRTGSSAKHMTFAECGATGEAR